GFTVPAINVRGMSYDTARAIFRTAIQLEAGAFLLEIARSEIAYTEQRPGEYVAVMLAAALREGFRGPVFIQGDHFQVNAKKFAVDQGAEVGAVKALANEAIHAGFFNIDIDTSTLVDLSKPNLDAQQRLNYEVGIDILRTVRSTTSPSAKRPRSTWRRTSRTCCSTTCRPICAPRSTIGWRRTPRTSASRPIRMNSFIIKRARRRSGRSRHSCGTCRRRRG